MYLILKYNVKQSTALSKIIKVKGGCKKQKKSVFD